MAVAIAQIKVPEVIQQLIHSYVFFSKTETTQREHKRKLLHHLHQCERWCFTDGLFTTFYYKQLIRHTTFPYKNHVYYVCEYNILHTGFCNDCHNYLYAGTTIPGSIECNCSPMLMPDVD
jgi:hypothetical protein